MTRIIDEISFFLPAYNLEAQIKKTVDDAFKVIPKIARKYEIIVINDGSRDKTGEVLEKICIKYKKLKIITHKVNKGYGAALRSGFYGSKYNWIAFTDGDGQFDISELPKLIKMQKSTNADLVAGYYRKRRVSFLKIVTSKLWELVVFVLFGLRVRDIDCGFKLISKKVIEKIPKLESERGAFISSELLIKAKKDNFKIAEIGVTHYARVEGKGTGRDINVIIQSFKDLFTLWKKLR
jgi:glycosyltransferase involved in cell wall biosynthesis